MKNEDTLVTLGRVFRCTAVLNARQRRHRNFDIRFSTGSSALSVGSEIGRFDFSRLVQ